MDRKHMDTKQKVIIAAAVVLVFALGAGAGAWLTSRRSAPTGMAGAMGGYGMGGGMGSGGGMPSGGFGGGMSGGSGAPRMGSGAGGFGGGMPRGGSGGGFGGGMPGGSGAPRMGGGMGSGGGMPSGGFAMGPGMGFGGPGGGADRPSSGKKNTPGAKGSGGNKGAAPSGAAGKSSGGPGGSMPAGGFGGGMPGGFAMGPEGSGFGGFGMMPGMGFGGPGGSAMTPPLPPALAKSAAKQGGKPAAAAGAKKAPKAANTAFVTLKCKDGEDITEALTEALGKHRSVLIPKGTYRVSSPVDIPANTRLKGEGAVLNVSVRGGGSTAHVFLVSGDKAQKDKPAKRCENVTISGLTFVSERPEYLYAVCGMSVKNLTLSGLETRGMGLAVISAINTVNAWDGTPDPNKTGGIKGKEDLSQNVTITNCFADCKDNRDGAVTGILIQYTDTFNLQNCHVANCYQGIQFWGGDSDYSRGGKPENYGALSNGRIIGCRARNVAGGGIWGSFGENVVIRDCQVSDCGDVGIDFEGSRNCRAENCKVYDCVNGNYATFQYCTGRIEFKNCLSVLTGKAGTPGDHHYMNSNATQMAGAQEIVFEGCTFESKTMGKVNAFSAMKRFVFRNNTCRNTCLTTVGNNIYNVEVENNRFEWTSSEKPGVILLAETRGPQETSLKVTGNKVNGKDADTGIQVSCDSPGARAKAFIENNTVAGCETPIRVRSVAGIDVTGDYKGKPEKY